jgi:hypothetical protein
MEPGLVKVMVCGPDVLEVEGTAPEPKFQLKLVGVETVVASVKVTDCPTQIVFAELVKLHTGGNPGGKQPNEFFSAARVVLIVPCMRAI